MGSRLAAFLAGYQPKRMPIIVDTTKAKIIEVGETTKRELEILEITKEVAIPKTIPIRPPVKVRMTDSTKN